LIYFLNYLKNCKHCKLFIIKKNYTSFYTIKLSKKKKKKKKKKKIKKKKKKKKKKKNKNNNNCINKKKKKSYKTILESYPIIMYHRNIFLL